MLDAKLNTMHIYADLMLTYQETRVIVLDRGSQ